MLLFMGFLGPARSVLMCGVWLSIPLSVAAKPPSKIFVPSELATSARGEPLASFRLRLELASDRQWSNNLSIAVDGVTVVAPSDWDNARAVLEKSRHKSVVLTDVYVRPGQHKITYKWLQEKSVGEYSTFASDETVNGIHRSGSGFIRVKDHKVTHILQYEDQLTLSPKQSFILVPDPNRVSEPLCMIDDASTSCDAADRFIEAEVQFIRDHTKR